MLIRWVGGERERVKVSCYGDGGSIEAVMDGKGKLEVTELRGLRERSTLNGADVSPGSVDITSFAIGPRFQSPSIVQLSVDLWEYTNRFILQS
jgi:hypothetical protein